MIDDGQLTIQLERALWRRWMTIRFGSVQAQFGPNAAKYATSRVHAKGASLARLVELIEPQAEWTVLDVATAAGHTAFVFAPHVAHVLATDVTPEMLAVAFDLAAEKGIPTSPSRQPMPNACPLPMSASTW